MELTREQSKLVEKNIDLAHFLARESWNRNKANLDLDEVVSIAYQGLVKAALKFNPEMMSAETVASGKAFAGFARQKINGAILDWQRDIDHVQRSYRQVYKQLQLLGYTTEHRNSVSYEEFAVKLELPVEKIKQIIRTVENSPVSLNNEVGDPSLIEEGIVSGYTDGNHLMDRKNTVEGSVIETSITSAVRDAYSDLPELHKVIIAMRWYQNDDFQTIAVVLGVSLNVVRDAHTSALDAIHQAMVRTASDLH